MFYNDFDNSCVIKGGVQPIFFGKLDFELVVGPPGNPTAPVNT